MNNIAIKVENLSKRYRIGLEEELPDTLVGALTQAVKRPLRNWRRLRRLTHFDDERPTTNDQPTPSDSESSSFVLRRSSGSEASPIDTLWALRDVSFEVQRGEVVGIIGRNGAGKSTLLKILARITHPTSGRAVINGRVGSLLEVGTGFHAELTGRENIYLNGTILGMTKAEVARKFDEIVDFSGVEKFIDTPVKRYSSGMRVRLAFSVAAHLDPEILLVDEVLAVGDVAFQKKCLGKMESVASEGRTVLFVSHNMAAIQSMCAKSILLESGGLTYYSETGSVINGYLALLETQVDKTDLRERKDRRGNGLLTFQSIDFEDLEGSPLQSISPSQSLNVRIKIKARQSIDLSRSKIGFGVFSMFGQKCFSCSTYYVAISGTLKPGFNQLVFTIQHLPLAPGRYRINMIASVNDEIADWIRDATYINVEAVDFFGTGRLPPEGQNELVLVDQEVHIINN